MDNKLNSECKQLANVNALVASQMKQLSKIYNVPLDQINDRINYYI